MTKWGNPFAKKKEIADEKKVASLTGAILAMVKNSVLQIFADHKLDLWDKDPVYIISAVCGLDKRGPLTDQQQAIHDKIMPSVNGIFEALGIKNLPEEQKAAMIFIIRLLIMFKIMFMMELFKNKRTQIMTDEKNIQDVLGKIETVGRA